MNTFNVKKCMETINIFVGNSPNVALATRFPISQNDLIREKALRCLVFDELTTFYTEHCLDHDYCETDDGYLLHQAINFIVFCGDV